MDDGACAPRCLLQEQEKHKELACALSRWVKTSTRCARPCAASRTPKSRRAPKRSEEHTSELQSLMRISYAVFCLKKKKTQSDTTRPVYQRTNISQSSKKTQTNQSEKY